MLKRFPYNALAINWLGRGINLNSKLIPKLIQVVRHKLKEQEQQAKELQLTIEQILNEAGVHSLGPQAMAELRAEVYEGLGFGLSAPGTLRERLEGFLFDYEVFRISELRYFFPADKEADIISKLTELGYVAKDLPGEQEPVWRPKFTHTRTVQNKLSARPRAGNKAYFDYLFYTPSESADKIIKH